MLFSVRIPRILSEISSLELSNEANSFKDSPEGIPARFLSNHWVTKKNSGCDSLLDIFSSVMVLVVGCYFDV